MAQLSPEGSRAVEDIAHRTGFSPDAVTSILFSIVAGRGGMAQFSHPDFGGSSQWMAGGDVFNNRLKARVDDLCNELSALVQREPGSGIAGSFQSQSQGSHADAGGASSSLLAGLTTGATNWWPADHDAPSSVGAQNEIRYASFLPLAALLSISTEK